MDLDDTLPVKDNLGMKWYDHIIDDLLANPSSLHQQIQAKNAADRRSLLGQNVTFANIANRGQSKCQEMTGKRRK